MFRNIWAWAVFSALFLKSTSSVWAQYTDPKHQLLWEISGNGMEEKSYLYGTYHSSDSKFFEFSDSVLVCLDRAKAYAMEVSMEDLVAAHSSQTLVNEFQEGNSNVLYGGGVRLYRDHEGNTSGLGLDYLPVNREWLYHGYGRVSLAMNDNYPTFLDAYLCQLAMDHGKAIYGLENIEDQLNVDDDEDTPGERATWDSPEEDSEAVEGANVSSKLPKLYFKGRLEEMVDLMESYYGTESNYYQALIIHRNRGMVKSLLELIPKQSTFIAVGTGHLGGEYGIIELLRQEGYTVRPITAVFSGLRRKYDFVSEVREREWVEVEDAAGGMKVDFPMKPHFWPVPALNMRMHFLPDIGTGIIYFAGSFGLPEGWEGIKPRQFQKMVEEMLVEEKRSRDVQEKKVVKGEWKGVETLRKYVKSRYSRTQFYWNGTRGYFLMTITPNGYEYSDRSLRFFESFQPGMQMAGTAQTFVSALGAFSVKMPGEVDSVFYHSSHFSKNEPKMMHQFWSFSPEDGNAYLAGFVDYLPGMGLSNPTPTLDEFADWILEERNLTEHKREEVECDGLRGLEVEFSEKSYLGSGKIRVFERGGRRYFFAVNDQDDGALSGDAKLFLKSIHFHELPLPNWQSHSTISKEAEFILPSHPKYSRQFKPFKTNSLNDWEGLLRVEQGISSDPGTGNWFMFNKFEFSPLYQAEALDSLSKMVMELFWAGGDTLIGTAPIHVDGFDGQEVRILHGPDELMLRLRLIPASQDLYLLAASYSDDLNEKVFVDPFFEDFSILEAQKGGGLFSNKSDILRQYLESNEPEKWELAQEVMSEKNLNQTDMALLGGTLNRSLVRTGEKADYFREVLVHTLIEIGGNMAIPYLENLVSQENSRSIICLGLKSLMALKTPEGVSKALALMNYDSVFWFKGDSLGEIYSPLFSSDTLEKPNEIFQILVPFWKRTAHFPMITSIVAKWVIEDGYSISVEGPAREALIQRIKEDANLVMAMEKTGENPDDWEEVEELGEDLSGEVWREIFNLFQDMGGEEDAFEWEDWGQWLERELDIATQMGPAEELKPILDSLFQIQGNESLIRRVALLQHKWGWENRSAYFEEALRAHGNAQPGYEFLKMRHSLDLFPEDLASQEKMAMDILWDYLENEKELEVSSIDTLGVFEKADKRYFLMEFEVKSRPGKPYVGMAGAFPLEKEELLVTYSAPNTLMRRKEKLEPSEHFEELWKDLMDLD